MNRALKTACLLAVLFSTAPAFAATYTWNTTNSGNWNVTSNWNTLAASANATSLYFGGATTLTATNNTTNNFNLNSLNFYNTAGTMTLSGSALSFVSNGSTTPTINMTGAGTAVIAGDLVISNSLTVTVNSGAGSLWLGTSSNSSAFTGSQNITINNNSSNKVWIPDIASWSGNLFINSGYVEAANTGGDLFGESTILNVAAGATFDFNTNAESMGGIAGAGTITGNAGIACDAAGNRTFSGSFIGTGTLTQNNANILTLSGSNTFTGATTISQGQIQLSSSAALLNSTVTVSSSANSLIFNTNGGTVAAFNLGGLAGSGNLSLTDTNGSGYAANIIVGGNNASTLYSGQLSGSGTLTKAGSGTLTLTGATSSVATIISGGALQANDGAGLSTGNLALNGGVLQSNFAALTFNRSLGAGSGNIQWTGSGGFSATGGALTVNLSGAPNPLVWGGTGATQYFLAAGKALVFGSPTANNQVVFQNNINLNGAAQTISVTAGAGGDSALVSGVLSGNGTGSTLTKTGSGLLILAASNTYAGTTTVSAGTLQLGSGLVNGSVQGNITDTAALNFNNPASQTYAGVISGTAGSVSLLGPGMLTLTASNTYTGSTTIGGGTANLNYAIALGSSGSILPSGSTATTSFSGGTLLLTGSNAASRTQTLGKIAFNGGASGISLAPNGGTLALVLGGTGTFARGSGATVNFNLPASTYASITAGTMGIVTNGILTAGSASTNATAYATVNGTDWATVTSSKIAALASYTGTFASGANIDMASTAGTWAGGTANTLAFRSATVPTLTLSGVAQLQAGGILVGSGVGAVPTQIIGGSLTSATNEMVVEQFNTAAPLTISSPINGTTTLLTKSGPGMLVLNAVNNFGGGLLVDAGTLQLGPSAMINSNGTVTTSGGVFDLNGSSPTVGMLAGASGSIVNSASTAATLNVTVGIANIGSYAGVLANTGSGALNLTINFSAGTYSQFALNGSLANTFTGAITVNGTGYTDGADAHGILGLRSDGVLGAPGNGITLNNGGTLFNGYLPKSGGAWTNTFDVDPNLSASRTITMGTGAGGVFRVWSNSSFTVNSLISGNGNFTKADLGTLILSNTGNNWGGTTALTDGTLLLAASNVLPVGTSLTLGLPASSNVATLGLHGCNQTVGSLATTGTVAASQIIGNSSTTSDCTLTVSGVAGASTFGGNIVDAIAPGTHKTNLAVSGGVLTLSNINGYTGTTTVNGGMLDVGTSNAIWNSTAVTVNSGATLYLANGVTCHLQNLVLNNSTLAAGTVDTTWGSWVFNTPVQVTGASTISAGSVNWSGSQTITVVNPSDTLNVTGNFAGASSVSNNFALIMAGSGTMILGSSSSYSGGTTITGGAMIVGNDSGLGSGALTMSPTAGAAAVQFTSASPTIGGLASTGAGTSSIVLGNSANDTPTNITVGGNNASSTFNGSISDQSAAASVAVGSLVKTGTGTLTLGGSNSYTGGTSIAGGGLQLDFSQPGAPAANILNPAFPVALTNGTAFQVQGAANAANSQGIAALSLSPGAMAFRGISGSGGTLSVALGAVSRSSGAMIDFTLPVSGGVSTTSGTASTLLTDTNGVAYATVAGTDWAAKDANNVFIVAGSAISGFYTPSTAGNLSGNADVASGINTTLGANTVVSSLRFNQNQGTSIAIGYANTLTTGGILVTPNVATPGSVIYNGTLSGPAGGDLVIMQNSSQDFAISSTIADNGGSVPLNKYGAGNLVLENGNTYTGATSIWGGTITLAAQNALAGSTLNYNSLGGSLSFGGLTYASFGGLSGSQNLALTNAASAAVALTVGGNSQTTTYSGILSGSGGLTMNGSGMLTLAGNNTYSGGTTISGGTLNFTTNANLGASGGTLSFLNGGTLLYSSSAALSWGTTRPLNFAGNGTINVGNPAGYLYLSPTCYGNGTLTKAGPGEFAFESSGAGLSGPIVIAQGTVMQTSEHMANVTALTVQNGGQYEIFDDQNNDAGQGANFSMASAATITLNGMGAAGIPGALLYTPQSTGNQGVALVTNNIVLQTDSSVVVNNSSTNIFKLRLNGNISGSGSLIKDYMLAMPAGRAGESTLAVNSMGILALGGTNSYGGNTTINSGTILLQSPAALPATTNVYIDSANSSTLDLGGCNATIAGLWNGPNGGGTITNSGTNQIASPSNATLTVTGQGNFSGVIQDGLYKTGLAMSGSGMLTLSGPNTYSGGTYINGGTLQLGSNSALGAGSVTANAGTIDLASYNPILASLNGAAGAITNSGLANSLLTVNQAGATTFSGTISDGATNKVALAMTGAGTLTLAGSNTYSGGTTLTAGTLNLGSAESAGSFGPLGTATAAGSIVFGGGFLQYSSANQYDYSSRFSTAANQAYNVDTNGQSVTWATALISSGGSLTKVGAGTLTLTGSNTYSGPTTLSAGTLQADFSQNNSPAANILPTGAPLVLGANTALRFLGAPGAANSQSIGMVSINPGAAEVQAISTGTLSVAMGNIARSSGGMIDFTLPASGGISTTSGVASSLLTDTNGVAYATVAGSDWAAKDANNVNLVAGSTIAGFYTPTTYSTLAGNADVASGTDTTLASNTIISSLRFSQNEGRTINLGGNTLTTGGILVTPNVATAGSTISGGTLSGPAGGDLVLVQNSGQDFTISATIADNTVSTPLNKYGTGNLVLGGGNTYTGNTSIWAGSITLANPNALAQSTLNYNSLGGSVSFGALTSASLGGLSGNQSLALQNVSSAPVALTVGGGNQSTTYSGVLSDGGSGGSLTLVGSGMLTLAAANTYLGDTTVTSGSLALANVNALATSTLNILGGSMSFGTLTSVSLGGLEGSQAVGLANAASTAVALSAGGDNESTVYSGVLSGGGRLTKVGSGTLALAAANTYSGGTTISGGTLQLGNGGTTGSLSTAGTISDNGVLAFNRSNTVVQGTDFSASAISGSGSLLQLGGGTLTLTGTNSFTGGISIQNGTVNFASTATTTLGASGAPIVFQNGGTLLYSGSVNCNPTTTRPLNFLGNGTIAVSNSSVNLYFTTDYVTGTGTMTKSGPGEMQFGSTGSGQHGPIVVAQGTLMETSPRIPYVTGMLVQSGAQWEINDDALNQNFGIATGAIVTLNGMGPVGSGGALLYTPQSNNQGIAYINNNVVLQTDSSVVVNDSSGYIYKLQLNGNISGSGGLTKDYLSGVPAGRGGEATYFANSMGILSLGGTNNYGGNTTIKSGTILLQSNSALPATTTLAIDSSNGSTLDLGGYSPTIAGLNNGPNGGGVVTNGAAASNSTLTIGGSGFFSGVVRDGASSTTALWMSGPGALTLANSNTYSGGTIISGGTLQLGDGTSGHDGSIQGAVTANGALAFDLFGSQTYSGAISGTGTLAKLGGGSVTLAGNNSTFGGTTINSNGTLQLGNSAALGTGSLVANAGTVDLAGFSPAILSLSGQSGTITNSGAADSTLTVNQSVASTFSGALADGVTNRVALVKMATGTLTLAGSSNYSGGTTLSNGILAVTNSASLGAATGNLSIGPATLEVAGGFASMRNVSLTDATATIQVDPTFTYSNGGTISGAGGLNKTGAGTLELAGTSALSASSNVNAGLLQVDGSLTIPVLNINNAAQLAGSGTISTTTGDGLLYQSSAASTFGGTLAGIGSLEVASGTLTLSGANTYQHTTYIDPANAMLRMGATNALPFGPGTGNVSLSSPGVLDLAGFTTNINGLKGNGTVDNLAAGSGTLVVGNNNASSTFSGAIQNTAGSLALDKTGNGMLTLTGSSTYTGGTTLDAGTLVVANGTKGSALGWGNLTLNNGTLAGAALGGSIGGLVQAGSSAHTIAPGAGLPIGQYGMLNLNGGLSTNSYTTLAFNLGAPVAGGNYSGDLITIGSGGLSVGVNTTISFGSNPSVLGDYRLFGGNVGGATTGNFLLPSAPGGDKYSLSTSVDSGYLDLVVASTSTGAGTWSGSGGNWSSGLTSGGSGQTAVLSPTTTAAVSITLDEPVTLGTLQFGNTGGSVNLTGTRTLSLDNGAGVAQVNVSGGSNSITAPISLAGSVDVSPAAGSTLTISGSISQDGNSMLTLSGPGTLILSGSNSYSGGTDVTAGTLIATGGGAIPEGSSLTVGGGASSLFASTVVGGAVAESPRAGTSAEIIAVPEPGTIALLLAALWSAAIYCRFRRPKAFGVR